MNHDKCSDKHMDILSFCCTEKGAADSAGVEKWVSLMRELSNCLLKPGKDYCRCKGQWGLKCSHWNGNKALWCSLVLTADYEKPPVRISQFPDLLPFWVSSTECPLMLASSTDPSTSYYPPVAEHSRTISLLVWILFSWIQSLGFLHFDC